MTPEPTKWLNSISIHAGTTLIRCWYDLVFNNPMKSDGFFGWCIYSVNKGRIFFRIFVADENEFIKLNENMYLCFCSFTCTYSLVLPSLLGKYSLVIRESCIANPFVYSKGMPFQHLPNLKTRICRTRMSNTNSWICKGVVFVVVQRKCAPTSSNFQTANQPNKSKQVFFAGPVASPKIVNNYILFDSKCKNWNIFN